MNLTGKIKAKIHHGTFNGVPEDVQVTVFIAGVKNPLKATLTDIEIKEPPKPAPPPPPMLTVPGSWFTTFSGPVTVTLPDGSPDYVFTSVPFGNAGDDSVNQVSGSDTFAALKKSIPGLGDVKTPCPECIKGSPAIKIGWTTGGYPISWTNGTTALMEVIIHLNDQHKWSREAIADWLETKDWDLQFVPVEEAAS